VNEDKAKLAQRRRAALPANSAPEDWPSFARHLWRTPSGTAIDFDPGQWMPIKDAFTRIRTVVGDRTAVRDMQEDLCSGRLVVARRWVARHEGARWFDTPDGAMLCEQLPTSFWQGGRRVYTRPWPNDWTQIEVLDLGQDPGSLYYLSRASLERRYPLLEEASADSAPSVAAKPEEPERRNTWVTVYDWGAIYAEIAGRCFDTSGRLAIPQQNMLVADMTVWCGEKFRYAPHERELRKAVKTVCDRLREEPKPLKKKPSR
jgi:hypothetical protein